LVVVVQVAAQCLVELVQQLAHCQARLVQMEQQVDSTAVVAVVPSTRKATQPELVVLVVLAL
jgi:hypothetical protein